MGILLIVDEERLLNISGKVRDPETIRNDKRTIQKLISFTGKTPWREVTPKLCAEWLAERSERERRDIRRIMKNLFVLQCEAAVCDENPWSNYEADGIERKSLNHVGNIKKYIEQTMLSAGQSSMILRKCYIRLETCKASGIDVAVLLVLTLGIDIASISALDLSDFKFLMDYENQLTVSVTKEYIRPANAKNYRLIEIEDAYERRMLPVISLISRILKSILKKENIRMGSKKAVGRPLVPLPTNKLRRMNSKDLEKEITRFVQDIEGMEFKQISDVENIRLPSILNMMRTTAFRELKNYGFEDEELRVIKGMRPKLTSGKSYYDRFNESAIRKMGAMMERWINTLESAIQDEGKSTITSRTRMGVECKSNEPECCTQAVFDIGSEELDINSIPEDGLILELGATFGISGKVEIITKK